MKHFKLRILISALVLTAIILFNIYTYFSIRDKAALNKEIVRVGNLLVKEEDLADEVAEKTVALSIHRSFSKEKIAEQRSELGLSIAKLLTVHQLVKDFT